MVDDLMELKYLVTFATILQCDSFQEAAQKLNYTQSTITFQMQQLENELHVQLFEKIGRKMAVTQAGRELVSYVDAVLQSVERLSNYGKEYARVKDPSSYFYLVVRGDSMEPRIHDGDLALVHRQDTLENGDLGVLIYGDEGEGTLKRYLQRGNCVVLQPFNPAYKEMVIKGEELNHLHIAGRVVETKAKW